MIVYIKSKEEIEGFKNAGRITGQILKELLNSVKVGITTKYLDDLAKKLCKKYDVIPTFLNYNGFPSAICSSVNNTLVHGIPNDKLLQKDDIITIDFGATKDGFIGDTAETISIGKHYEIIDYCRNSLINGIKMAKEGNKLSDISLEISKNSGKYKIPTVYGGHGISRYKLHDHPFVPNIVNYINDITLKNGMVIAIEPMLIDSISNFTTVLDDKWSVVCSGLTAHCEHTILINNDNPIILTL